MSKLAKKQVRPSTPFRDGLFGEKKFDDKGVVIGGETYREALARSIASGLAADPTWSVMTDEEWADKVIKRTDALIKKLEES